MLKINPGLEEKEYLRYVPTPFDIDLQWFAAEDEGRSEEPTEHKLKKAREEGKVAKSQELTSSIILLFGIVTIGLLSSFLFENSIEMLNYFFVRSGEIDITSDRSIVTVFYYYFIRMTLPIIGVVFIAAVIGNLLQVGFLFTLKPITPDLNKIVPKFGKFIQKAFFGAEAAFNLGKSIFKVIIIGVIAFLNIRAQFNKMINLINIPFMEGFSFIASLAFRIIVQAAIAMLVMSIIDYFFQRRQHMESLKMSKQEIKEERKMYEGDPFIKSRLRQRMQEIMMRNMMKEVPKADVVITNPTHYAIAMQWNRATMASPVVVAKGVDNMAFRIKEIALEHGVPVVENKPLARALYAEVEIGDPIPEKYYEVMALILAQVYRLSGKTLEAV